MKKLTFVSQKEAEQHLEKLGGNRVEWVSKDPFRRFWSTPKVFTTIRRRYGGFKTFQPNLHNTRR